MDTFLKVLGVCMLVFVGLPFILLLVTMFIGVCALVGPWMFFLLPFAMIFVGIGIWIGKKKNS